ncbi:hypothetical protein, partial [Nocardia mangyaensis]|uniref:hypothetical protein n=1 Tax=Nocardia mangyaensis TaxID=2213200 RepID=UPI00267475AF
LGRMISITLKPFFHDKKEKFIFSYIHSVLYEYCKQHKIHLWLCAELTDAVVLHWHGQYKIASASARDVEITMKLFHRRLRLLIGGYKDELIRKEVFAFNYCTKDWVVMRKLHKTHQLWVSSNSLINPLPLEGGEVEEK